MKKMMLAGILLLFLVIGVPFIQSFIFTQNTSGKIAVDQRINAPYLKESDKDFILMFFGYVGCTKVCTPILHQLDDFYDSAEFMPLKQSVGVTFVNLMPELAPDQPEVFAKSFNSDFQGVYLSQKELIKIERQYSLFFSKSLARPGEIDHSDHLYLIKRQKNGGCVLKNIYNTHPLNKELIIEDIHASLKDMK